MASFLLTVPHLLHRLMNKTYLFIAVGAAGADEQMEF
jgi:hypothetical protein